MPSPKRILISLLIAVVAVAIVFRVPKIRSVVVGV
jgi:hypothetical protein